MILVFYELTVVMVFSLSFVDMIRIIDEKYF